MSQQMQQYSTRWKNPTEHTVKFKVLVEAGQFQHVEIKPGEVKELPSSWDRAIHDVRGGVVMGGHAPQLVREGQQATPVHSSITESAAGAVFMPEKLEAERVARQKAEAENEALKARLAELEARHAPQRGGQRGQVPIAGGGQP